MKEIESKEFFNLNKTNKIIGLTIGTIGLILLLSIVSYILYFRQDQSLAIGGWEGIKKIPYYQTQNWINKIGLFLGYFFVDVQFGLMSLILPIYLFMLSANFFYSRHIFNLLKWLGNTILLLFFGCSILALAQNNILSNINFPIGGGFGTVLAGKNGAVYPLLGFVGILLIWCLFLLASLIWFFDFEFSTIARYLVRAKSYKQNKINLTNNSNHKNQHLLDSNSNSSESVSNPIFDTIFDSDDINIEPKEQNPQSLESEYELEIINNEDDSDELANTDYSSPNSDIKFEIQSPSDDDHIDTKEANDISPVPEHDLNPNLKHPDNNTDIPLEINVETPTPHSDTLLTDFNDSSYENLPPYDPRKDLSQYQFPSIDLLENHGSGKNVIDKDQLEQNKNQIISTLNNFNIAITSIKATVGPTVTLYEIQPKAGIRINKIKSLENDIALSLAALGIRIIAPIPGKNTIGIEVPNLHRQIVSMRSVIQSERFQNAEMELPIALGKTISNEVVIADLAKMPHLLMAGATGQGKSVGINAILTSLLYKKHPAELKLVMVDPKKVELSIYSTIEKHYLAKLPYEEESVITDVTKVIHTVNSLCIEMENRYDLLKAAQVRNIKEYNYKFKNRQLNPLNGHHFMPYIVLIIDEFADLIMTAGKEIETPIARLAQLSRAVGIHLIIATQRPSVKVITGLIKANFPARISFAVSSSFDSKTILDSVGAEQLVGQGDMLLSLGNQLIRVQCAFIDTPEVAAITQHIQSQQSYGSAYELPEYVSDEDKTALSFDKKDLDELFASSAREVVISQMGSISLIQRKLSIGHNRAGRIIDQLEAFGIVGPNKGSKPREVYFTSLDELERHLETITKQ